MIIQIWHNIHSAIQIHGHTICVSKQYYNFHESSNLRRLRSQRRFLLPEHFLQGAHQGVVNDVGQGLDASDGKEFLR